MKLSELNKFINVFKDKDFSFLGSVKRDKDNLLAFVEDEENLKLALKNEKIVCLITKEEFKDSIKNDIGVGFADNPRKAFYDIHQYLFEETDFYKREVVKKIGQNAKIHPSAIIGEKVVIGNNVTIGEHVVIYDNTTIGDDVIIRAGSIIGSEGFAFNDFGDKRVFVPHAGGVFIGDRVEIQANTCVVKAIFENDTYIGEDTKVDNLVHIAHGVKIGKKCFIVANALLGGNSTLGDNVWVGPSATVSSYIKIGDDAYITLGSVVTKDVPAQAKVSGNFAIDHGKFIEFIKSIR